MSTIARRATLLRIEDAWFGYDFTQETQVFLRLA